MASKVDICLLIDYTGSMSTFLIAAKKAIREFVPTFSICEKNIDRVSILGYGDYCDTHVTKWSEWKSVDNAQELIGFVDRLLPDGGGDNPEAVKTGLQKLIENISKRTIVVLLTDAPPHTEFTGSDSSNINAEKKLLGDNFDWCVLSSTLASVGGSVWTVFAVQFMQSNFASCMHIYP